MNNSNPFLVPELVNQLIEKYTNPKTNQQERFQVEARLVAIQNAIR